MLPKSFPGVGAFDHLEWIYDGAFEQLFGLGRGEFEQKFCKKYKCPGFARGGGMLKLRFDWYISPSKGNQRTTQGKEKILLTSVGIDPTNSGLDLPLL